MRLWQIIENESTEEIIEPNQNSQDNANTAKGSAENAGGGETPSKNATEKGENLNDERDDNSSNNVEKSQNDSDENGQKPSMLQRIRRFFSKKEKSINDLDDEKKINNKDEATDVIDDKPVDSSQPQDERHDSVEYIVLNSFGRSDGSAREMSLNNQESDLRDILISNLISRFIKQQFKSKHTDLNQRSMGMKKSTGHLKWDVKKMVEHITTSQYTKVPSDRYGYEYDCGKHEAIPLSFYFDLSPSMMQYTSLLASMAHKLLQKGVRVIVGFNEYASYQINEIDGRTKYEDLIKFLKSDQNSVQKTSAKDPITNETIYCHNGIKYKFISGAFDEYLLARRAEKCVVFSDDDPRDSVINLSQKIDVYWFNFDMWSKHNYDVYKNGGVVSFEGVLICTYGEQDIIKALKIIGNDSFGTLKNRSCGKPISIKESKGFEVSYEP